EQLGMSRTQLHRKLTALTNQPAARFIRSLRLPHAKKLLRENGSLVNQVAFWVGFNSHAYFSKCFHEEFGCSPTEFTKTHRVE
ncbi:MAG: helix-turn-helix transcriptional regulator, partial [candidate division KSB1 bacterium]